MRGKIFIGIILLLSSCLKDDTVSPDEQLSRDIRTIDSYLTSNSIFAIKDASGIRLVITELGDGPLPPNPGNDVTVKYTGKLLSNGSVFDSGTTTGKLTQYILGWQIGMALLPAGTKATLYIPSGYAYGTRGIGSIPANANLIFDVELESVVSTQAQQTRLQSDIVAIDEHLGSNEDIIIHPSGVRYMVTTENINGISPDLYDQVRLKFKGRLLSNNSVFYESTIEPSSSFSSRVINFEHGLIIGLPLMREGEKAIFYVPSGLAYGTQEVQGVPANSVVIIEIELLEVL